MNAKVSVKEKFNRLNARLKSVLKQNEFLKKKAYFASPTDMSANNPCFPWLYYDKGLFYNQDSLGCVFKLTPFNYHSFSKTNQVHLIEDLNFIFKQLGKDVVLQLVQVFSKDYSKLLDEYETYLANLKALDPEFVSSHVIYKISSLENNIDFLKKNLGSESFQGAVIDHYLVLYQLYPKSFSPIDLDFCYKSYFGMQPSSTLTKSKASSRFEFISEFLKLKEDFITLFNSRIFEPLFVNNGLLELSEGDLIDLLRSQLSVEKAFLPKFLSKKQAILNQVLDDDLFYSSAGFHFKPTREEAEAGVLSNRKTATFKLQLYPEVFNFDGFSPLLSLNKNFTITTSLYFDASLKLLRHEFPPDGGSSMGIKKLKTEKKVYDEQIAEKKDATLIASTVINTIGDDEQISNFKKALKPLLGLDGLGATYAEDTLFGPYHFISGLPFGFHPKEAKKSKMFVKTLSSVAGSLLPWAANFPKHQPSSKNILSSHSSRFDGSMYFSESGEIQFFDPRFLASNNKAMLVLGAQRSGKSFFNCNEAKTTLMNGGACFAIDPGGSMKTMFEANGGKYFTVDYDAPFEFNPFAGDIYDDEGKRDEAKLSYLNILLCVMVYGLEPDVSATQLNFAQTIIADAINAAYEENRKVQGIAGYQKGIGKVHSATSISNVTLPMVRAKIESEDHPEIAKDIKSVLKNYCPGGHYGHFFSSDFEELKADAVGIDTKPIEKDPKLVALIFLSLTFYADSVFSKRRKAGNTTYNRFSIDEAHQIMKGVFMQNYIENAILQYPKFNTQFVIISQFYSHFVGHPCGESVLSGCPHHVLFEQDDSFSVYAQDSNRSISKLNDKTLDLIKRLRRTSEMKYAPFYFFSKGTPKESGFFRYYGTPLDIATFSSDNQFEMIRLKHLNDALKEGFTHEAAKVEMLKRAAKEFE